MPLMRSEGYQGKPLETYLATLWCVPNGYALDWIATSTGLWIRSSGHWIDHFMGIQIANL